MELYLPQLQDLWVLILERGGWTLVALIGLSVLTIAAGLNAMIQLFSLRPFSSKWGAALALTEYIRSLQVGQVIASQVEERATIRAKGYLRRAQTGFRLLEWIVTAAPLLGLFGTVLGMIDAFQAMQIAGQSVNPADLAGGIWVALITTAAGMLVALLALALLTALDAVVDQFRFRLECVANEALATPFWSAEATGQSANDERPVQAIAES